MMKRQKAPVRSEHPRKQTFFVLSNYGQKNDELKWDKTEISSALQSVTLFLPDVTQRQ